jgi:hypothetical protein
MRDLQRLCIAGGDKRRCAHDQRAYFCNGRWVAVERDQHFLQQIRGVRSLAHKLTPFTRGHAGRGFSSQPVCV